MNTLIPDLEASRPGVGLSHQGMTWRNWLQAWCDGFGQPLEQWPRVQHALGLTAVALCACALALWLCTAADVSGRVARRQRQAMLAEQLEHATAQSVALDDLRRRSRALGASGTPEPVPDNGTLLKLISLAIDRSAAALDLFEPGSAVQVGGVDEALLHVRVRGDYAQLTRFVGELAVLAQPVIPAEMRVVRQRDGALLLEARLRVLGAPLANTHWQEAGVLRKLHGLADPFEAALAWTPALADEMYTPERSAASDGRVAGVLQAGGRRAALVRAASGWRLLESDASPVAQRRRFAAGAVSNAAGPTGAAVPAGTAPRRSGPVAARGAS